jgi:hypothetical protein
MVQFENLLSSRGEQAQGRNGDNTPIHNDDDDDDDSLQFDAEEEEEEVSDAGDESEFDRFIYPEKVDFARIPNRFDNADEYLSTMEVWFLAIPLLKQSSFFF